MTTLILACPQIHGPSAVIHETLDGRDVLTMAMDHGYVSYGINGSGLWPGALIFLNPRLHIHTVDQKQETVSETSICLPILPCHHHVYSVARV